MTAIYKILQEQEWREFQLSGVFTGAAIDIEDGYIHFSTAEQLQETLTKHFAGQPGLVVLELDSDDLDPDALKWEPARGGALFPHLYGALPLTAVRQAVTVPVLVDGRHALPPDFARYG